MATPPPPAVESQAQLPLAGIRVLDMTVVWAGPHCTQLLAEWGAEVIRVEPITRIQPSTRGAELKITRETIRSLRARGQSALYTFADDDPGERQWNRSAQFNSHARNKLSCTLDVMTPEGLDIFKRLVAISDVFVENNVPETIEKAGLTYEALAEVNPGLVMLRMPAYGLEGPYKNYRSFGNHIEAMAGHHYLRGYPDLDPSATGASFTADAAGGVLGAFAVLLGLRHRRRTGRGQQIELALVENFLPYLGELILDYQVNGRVPQPQGNAHPTHAPHGAYPCRGEDRWIAIDVQDDGQWRALKRIMGEPGWAERSDYDTVQGRLQDRAELDRRLAEWTRTQDRDDLFQRLVAEGIPAGPVQDEADLFRCPQLQHRHFFEELTQADTGPRTYPGLTFRMANTPNRLRTPPCMLGEHNDYVYRQLLGVSDEEYDRLVALGHIGTEYRLPGDS